MYQNQFVIQFSDMNMFYCGMENGNIIFGFHPGACSRVIRYANESLAYEVAASLNRFFDTKLFEAVVLADCFK